MGSQPVRRIVLTGPECTGKSTLAAQLAGELGAALVPEMARAYANAVKRDLTAQDVEVIAQRTIDAETSALRTGNTLVMDTDLVSTVVYGAHYYGFTSAWLERETRARLGDLYLLCGPDIPWVADGVRDRPRDRREMLKEFRDTLAHFGARVVEIAGSGDARLGAAHAALRAHGIDVT